MNDDNESFADGVIDDESALATTSASNFRGLRLHSSFAVSKLQPQGDANTILAHTAVRSPGRDGRRGTALTSIADRRLIDDESAFGDDVRQ